MITVVVNACLFRSLTRDDVANFLDDHYKGSRVVIASAGGVDHSQVNSFASKYFGDLSNEYKQKIPLPRGTRFTGSEFVYRDDSMPYLWGAVAVEGVGAAHPDALALKVLSVLFEALRIIVFSWLLNMLANGISHTVQATTRRSPLFRRLMDCLA